MNRTIVALLAIAIQTPSFAQSDGFDFKGLPLGSSAAALKSTFPEYYCSASPGNSLGDTTCRLTPEMRCWKELSPYPDDRSCREAVMAAMTYAGVRTTNISLRFYEDKLSLAFVAFTPNHFSDVVASIRGKHGEPSSQRNEPITNRMGASFENQIVEWKKAGSTIRAEKFASRLDTAAVKVFLDSNSAEFERRQALKAKQGSKDL